MKAWVLLAVCMGAAGAAAEESVLSAPVGQGWSILSGRRGGEDQTTVQAAIGWPGIDVELLRSAGPQSSFGGKLGFNWGFDGGLAALRTGGDGGPGGVVPEVKIQAVARVAVWSDGLLDFGMHVSPGLLLFFPGRFGPWYGLTLPFGASLGLSASDAMHISVLADVPFTVLTTGTEYGNWVVPVLMGVGIEYFLSSNLTAFFKLQMGPSFTFNRTVLALDGKLGIGWRL